VKISTTGNKSQSKTKKRGKCHASACGIFTSSGLQLPHSYCFVLDYHLLILILSFLPPTPLMYTCSPVSRYHTG